MAFDANAWLGAHGWLCEHKELNQEYAEELAKLVEEQRDAERDAIVAWLMLPARRPSEESIPELLAAAIRDGKHRKEAD
jgi:hypothetical protein